MSSQAIPAVHAGLSGSQDLEGDRLHADLHAHEDFDDLVRALEIRAGRRLNEPQRGICRRAYESHPFGVRRAVETSIERTNGRNAVGLFWRIIQDGEHEIMGALAHQALERGICPDCAMGGGRHVFDCPRAI